MVQQTGICLPGRKHRFNPWSRKIPHAVEQLSQCTATTGARGLQLLKTMCLKPVLRNKRSLCNENAAMKTSPCSLQLERPHAQQQRLRETKNKINNLKKKSWSNEEFLKKEHGKQKEQHESLLIILGW